jgi:hypothetical protein
MEAVCQPRVTQPSWYSACIPAMHNLLANLSTRPAIAIASGRPLQPGNLQARYQGPALMHPRVPKDNHTVKSWHHLPPLPYPSQTRYGTVQPQGMQRLRCNQPRAIPSKQHTASCLTWTKCDTGHACSGSMAWQGCNAADGASNSILALHPGHVSA